MKKLITRLSLIVVVCFFISSCQTTGPLTNRTAEYRPFALDFRKYSQQGFLFMPDEYYGEYEVKGIITVESHPTVNYLEGKIDMRKDLYMVSHFNYGDKMYTQVIEETNIGDLIEYVYNLALEWEGDAFTHFKSTIDVGKTDESVNTSYPFYSISGVVIKRL